MASSLCLTVNKLLSLWISVFLLLIFIQLVLVLFGREFIHSAGYVINTNIFSIVGLYVPVVLVAFALLAIILATYAKDRGALRCSLVCQASASLLILIGVIVFLLLNWTYVSWEHMTLWFCMCVGVQIQLVIVTALTCVSERRLTSDWE